MEELNLDFLSLPSNLLSLQELSLAATASMLWRSKEMKMAMEEVFDRHYPRWRDHNSILKMEKPFLEDLSAKISDAVTRIFNQAKGQMSLPQMIKTEVENKVLEKVEEVIYWTLYLIRDLKLDYKAAERIYWTTDGSIDEDKIFRLFWFDRLAEEPVKWEIFDDNLNLLQYLACIFAQEEFISFHRSDYIHAIKPPAMDNYDTLLTIMKTVILYYNNNKGGSIYNFKRVKFRTIHISTAQMLPICKRFCFYKAFLFFWERLNARQRFNYLENQSKTRSLWRNEATLYGTNQNLKIILFLMEQMNERQKYNFIFNNFPDVILTVSRNKNCKKFCMPLVEHFLPIISESQKYILLSNSADICNRSLQIDIELEIVHRLLKNVPINRPNFDSEFSFPVFTDNTSEIIYSFFENFNIPVLKVIIKNESSERRKKDLISFGELKYRQLMRSDNFQLLDQFLDEVLGSEAEKDKFKQDYNFLGEWIAQCRFDIVDNVLIWMHGAASQNFKIPLINLLYSSIPRNYGAIKKLLIWFFDAHGPLINNCQSKLELLNEFCSGLIYNLWHPKNYNLRNRVTAFNISRKILIFSFFSEKEIQYFKTNVLANEEKCIKFFCENEWQGYPIWENSRMSVLDDFLNFCNLPKEKMDYIRKSVLSEEWRNWALKRRIQKGHTEECEGSF